MLRVMTVCVACWASAALGATDDPNAEDLKRMQGEWMVTSMRVGGMDMPDEEAQALFRTVEGDRATVSRFTKVISRGTIKIDATKSPKTIDTTPDVADEPTVDADPSVAPRPILGIYEFDGDKLRICNARPGQPRPKSFDAKQYTGHTLIVWEPEKK